MAFDPTGLTKAALHKYELLSQERKLLQHRGGLPDWYTTTGWQMFKSKYQASGENAVYGRHKKIAHTLARHMPDSKDWESRFFQLLWDGWLSPASPALANTGLERGMPVSCSGQYIEDSVESFYDNMRETALLSKQGFGTSADFSGIRPRGTSISRGGEASGPVEVINDFFTTAAKISQGGNRRGSIGAYLDIEHPDWDEACDQLFAEPSNKNYGWIIKDSFTERLLKNDPDAHRRFNKFMHTKLVTGKGYLFFVDKANRHRPAMYKEHGLDIKASNLCCVSADQRVVTDRGIKTVGQLYAEGGTNLVMGLDGPSKASAMLLPRPDAPIVQIETAEGYRHKVTPDHRVWKKGFGWIEAQHLVPGDKLLIQQAQGLFGTNHKPDLAVIAGLVAGDGTFANEGNTVCIDLWEGKNTEHASEIEAVIAALIVDKPLQTSAISAPKFSGTGKLRLSSAPLTKVLAAEGFTKDTKLVVPQFVWEGTQPTVEGYLRGLYMADGNLQVGADATCVILSSNEREFLQDIQVLWANLGVKTSLCKLSDGGLRDFGPDRGGVYETKPVWRLLITSIQGSRIAHRVTRLGDFRKGDTADRFLKNIEKPGYQQKMYATFTGLTHLPNEDAYCLTVDSETHAWTVNGMVTHNTEIMLHSSEELTYSCILASMNIVHWEKIKNSSAVFDSTVFLDCLCQEFIETSEEVPGLEKVRNFTVKGRAIGLGIMGFHSLLQSQMIPYESLQAQFLSTEIAKHLHDESLRASQYLAQVHGEPEWCKGFGVRNTHRTAYAPTKTTALLMGGVSESWFPDPGMVFDAGSSVGELRRITPIIYELMKERDVYNEDTIKSIIDKLGSVQHVDWLTEEEKLVFRTAFEMDQRVLLRHAVLRQKYTCQGQSLNFYVPEGGSEDLISELMTSVVLHPDCLSQYYIYSRSGVVVSEECLACSA